MRTGPEIFEEIKVLLARKGMRQKELCQKSGVSVSLLQGWSRGDKGVTDEKLRCVAEVLGVSVEYLRGEPERLTPEQSALLCDLARLMGKIGREAERVAGDPEYARAHQLEILRRLGIDIPDEGEEADEDILRSE